MREATLKPDRIGILASSLCMVHCIATPFIFIAQSCSTACHEATATWWGSLDFLFLSISLFAIYQSTKNSSKTWIKYAMWVSWFVLLAVILNEKIQLISLPEIAIYFPAFALILLHIYNLKYCRCQPDNCCSR